eukprot:Skav214962  [mRNA]  locus=scaffold264:121937:122836:- [translate_table: standard]
MGVLDLLSEGSTLAGEVPKSPIFKSQFKPCLTTMQQFKSEAPKRNQFILSMTVSSGSQDIDEILIQETLEECRKGWADGPYQLDQLEPGSCISRRFPLSQHDKTRLIDDFSISAVNDSCIFHNKLDLHMIDTFGALVKKLFQELGVSGKPCDLLAKTYDLKSAYRQVPIQQSHLKYAYFSVFNHRTGKAVIYRMLTLPFGATHSVYSFLRLSRMLYTIATRGLLLMTANFYDDFILASPRDLTSSSSCGVELVFMLTGWEFARDGKKSTEFGPICRALGVEFNLSRSPSFVMEVYNTSS